MIAIVKKINNYPKKLHLNNIKLIIKNNKLTPQVLELDYFRSKRKLNLLQK